MSSVIQYVDGFGDVAIPGPRGVPGPKGDVGDVTAEAQEAATQAASSAAASASSASVAQTAAAASAASAQGAQLAAGISNSWWRTGSGAPPTTFADAVDAPIVGARFRDLASEETWVATSVATVSGEVTVEWEQTGPLPADMSATVEAQRLAKIVPGRGNPMGTTLPGTIPAADIRFIIQAGSATATVNAAGDFSFKWPEAFPTAILSVQLTSGDSTAHSGTLALRSATTLTTCQGNATGNASGAVRCDFIAIGY